MAKSKGVEKALLYLFPSRFGSHATMKQEGTLPDSRFIILKDEYGQYATEKRNLDVGTADPYRAATPEFRQEFFEAAKSEADLIEWLRKCAANSSKPKKPRKPLVRPGRVVCGSTN